MCGRYNLEIYEDFYDRYEIENRLDLKSSFNIAPSQIQPVVLQHSPNHVELMPWGLIPFWEDKKPKQKYLINMRDDTIISKGWAHKYLQFQRCLIPASGFYEWKKTSDGKIPYQFKVKGKKYITFAGMYSETENSEGKKERRYTIITTTPNSLMAPIHDRMPVILDEEGEKFWINPDNVEIDQLKEYIKPFKANLMERFPISTAVNSPMNNSKDIIKPIPEPHASKDNTNTLDSA